MDVAATKNAIARGVIKSQAQVQLKLTKAEYDYDNLFAIDNAWYYKHDDSQSVTIVKLCSETKKVLYNRTLNTLKVPLTNCRIQIPMVAFPTEDTEKYFIYDQILEDNEDHHKFATLIDVKPAEVEIIDYSSAVASQDCKLMCEEESQGRPHCVRYRLSFQEGRIMMLLLDSRGGLRKSVCVAERDDYQPLAIYHSSSNEEVFAFK